MRDDASDLDHVPGESGPPIVHRTFAYLRDPWAFDDALVETYGAVARTRLLGRTIILAASAELADALLIDREHCYSSANGWGHLIGELFPGGLMLRDFDDHQRHRRILRAAFTRSARQGYHAAINEAFARTLEGWAGRETLEFYPAIKRALLEQATGAFLGFDEGAVTDRLLRWFADIIAASIAVVRRRWPGLAWQRGLAARAEFEAFLRAEIPKRRGTAREDLFSRLCNAEDPDTGTSFNDDDVVSHTIFVLFAAHDTTASGLTALFDELSAAPELLERVVEECRGLGSGAEVGLAWAQLDAVPVVEYSFREALRVKPPVPYILRRTVRESSFGGYPLPARTPITALVRSVHDDPQRWPEPHKFDPDRFDPSCAPTPAREAWIPFGAGAHRCIGADLAMQQAKVFCYQFVRRFEIERVNPAPSRWRQIPLPKPVDGLPLRLRRR